jgi:chaperonin cofactor prefoldin
MPRSLSCAIIVIFLAAFSADAQSPDTASPPPSPAPAQGSAPPADAPKPKKVWTNENLSGANGAVSVVGDPKSNAKTSSPKQVNAQYVATVRKQLEKLQQQLADLDKQIEDLKNFSAGEPSTSASGLKLNKSYEREPIEVQIRALQKQKKDLKSQADALFDEARKKGVDPGQLR